MGKTHEVRIGARVVTQPAGNGSERRMMGVKRLTRKLKSAWPRNDLAGALILVCVILSLDLW
jgi:hypothetical protein